MISAWGSNHDTSDLRNTHLQSNFVFRIVQSVLVKRKRLNPNFRSKPHDWGNIDEKFWRKQIFFLGFLGVYDDWKQQKKSDKKWVKQNPRLALLAMAHSQLTQLDIWRKSR